MPIYELWRQATGSATAATVFLVVLVVIIFFAVNAVQQTASRMTWAFARDGALPARIWLAAVHTTLEVPVWSLVANAFVIFLCGCIYLGSTAAFTAVIGSSLILQVLSFTMPAMLLLWRKRSVSVLPMNRPFRLPRLVGWTANVLVIIFGVLFTVFFSFPAAMPVSGSSMSMSPTSNGQADFVDQNRLCECGHCNRWVAGNVELVLLCKEPVRWTSAGLRKKPPD